MGLRKKSLNEKCIAQRKHTKGHGAVQGGGRDWQLLSCFWNWPLILYSIVWPWTHADVHYTEKLQIKIVWWEGLLSSDFVLYFHQWWLQLNRACNGETGALWFSKLRPGVGITCWCSESRFCLFPPDPLRLSWRSLFNLQQHLLSNTSWVCHQNVLAEASSLGFDIISKRDFFNYY